MPTQLTVDQEAGQRCSEQGKRYEDQDGRDEDVPSEDRHAEHRHSRRAKADDRRDHVDTAENGPQSRQRQPHDPHVRAHTRRTDSRTQRCVRSPSEVGCTSRGDEASRRDNRSEQVQPVAEGVQPRKCDVGRADLQWENEIGEAEHDRRRIEQQHDRAVHGEQLVVLLVRQELHPRYCELAAHHQCHQPADKEEGKRGEQVHHSERLGVGRGDHFDDERPLGSLRRVRPRDHRRGCEDDHELPASCRVVRKDTRRA